IIAIIPALLFGAYNVGAQMMLADGVKDFSVLAAFIKGFLKILPIIIVSYAVGGFWEVLFAVVRKHEINEGLLVTGILFPLVLPPSIPLWQVAVGISFGVVVGKEIFGGTGMNVLNPALTARAFLFFAYPGNISGDKVWVASDAFTGATPLSVSAAAEQGRNAVDALCNYGYDFMTMFNGHVPGSIGETSALAILIGAVFLLVTRVGSWRIMLATVLGAVGTAALMNLLSGPNINAMLSIPPHYHLVMGGFLFGTVFMTTDPVSAAATNTGKWLYGLLIGVMVILIRSVNPAYPEGMMLAILFGNVFAPLFDYYVVQANIKRRLKRAQ
ncbi:MAG TPA: NADH:ubiquinone reductase (Na(+)-transporting) subunit B, partial [Candidatus Marinimicrobia bacterium]|nr:NADH:ubiquinone reductase (Na(+)-transporting) subunit B [Candidatus Neomarinimicrobiota bacterium]